MNSTRNYLMSLNLRITLIAMTFSGGSVATGSHFPDPFFLSLSVRSCSFALSVAYFAFFPDNRTCPFISSSNSSLPVEFSEFHHPGIFGMNLLNGMEDHPLAFSVIAFAIAAFIGVSYAAFSAYDARRRRQFAMLSRNSLYNVFFQQVRLLSASRPSPTRLFPRLIFLLCSIRMIPSHLLLHLSFTVLSHPSRVADTSTFFL